MSDQMKGYLALVLHAHLPFVRHPGKERSLEENWLFEALTESYLPLLEKMRSWTRDGMPWKLTLTLSPPLCAMLLDPLLQQRFAGYLGRTIELSAKEMDRTVFQTEVHSLATFYHNRLGALRQLYEDCGRNLIQAFAQYQKSGHLEIITSAATHALLPLLANDPSSLRAQIMIGRDAYRECFQCDPHGFWLPECAYAPVLDRVLQQAGIRWFIMDTHGLLLARPRPRYGQFAPLFTPHGIAAFGRDRDSANQVWSRDAGYPGDARYRDFYRDIGYDLELDYLRPYLAASDVRSFTGIKYHAITGAGTDKRIYDRVAALQTAADHAGHFLHHRLEHIRSLSGILDRPPILMAPYDAELFGHWWYEGPEFLDYLMRKLIYDQKTIKLTTPWEYLRENPSQQVATPSESSWGEEGYYRVWLNESNEWMYQHLQAIQERMHTLVRAHPNARGLVRRALDQAGRELLLAQSSDWAFILRTGTYPQYARERFTDHIVHFIALHEQLTATHVDNHWLRRVEQVNNIFPNINPYYWG